MFLSLTGAFKVNVKYAILELKDIIRIDLKVSKIYNIEDIVFHDILLDLKIYLTSCFTSVDIS